MASTENKLLIYVDILGFEGIGNEIEKTCKIRASKVREELVKIIGERITEASVKGEIVAQNFGKDDWVLVCESIDSVFKVITTILDHSSPFTDLEKIPLEFAVGLGCFTKGLKIDDKTLIDENSTILFLKTPLIKNYHEYYKSINSSPITTSYIAFTKEAYEQMSIFDKELFFEISSLIDNNQSITYYVTNPEKITQRGKVFEFLRMIGKSPSSYYYRIDKIWVPPAGYQAIMKTLEENKVVFITGDAEIGKTYTAARIMWEYYLKGYTPVWNDGGEPPTREIVRKKISEFQVQKESITYFEDPFGKFEFEDRADIRRTIDTFISKTQNSNSRVIITSREELFKEFEKEKLSSSDLRKFKIEMALMKPSYNSEEMEKILNLWSTEADCKWLNLPDIKLAITTRAIEKLPTPLGIWDFSYSSKDSTDISTIFKIIEEKSRTVKAAFAEEFAHMPKEKVLFLSLAMILNRLRISVIQSTYNFLLEKFKLNINIYPFSKLLPHFESKVAPIRRSGSWETGDYLKFNHPSYGEAIVTSWHRPEISAFSSSVFEELMISSDPLVRGCCGLFLTRNLASMPSREQAKKDIIQILNDKKAVTRYGVAVAVRESFRDIPLNDRLDILRIMINDKRRDVRAMVFSALNYNLKNFPENEYLSILLKGLNDKAAMVRQYAVQCISINIDDLPKSVLLKALEVQKELCGSSNWYISYTANILIDDFERSVNERLK
jgi:hypothetical protein